MRYPFAKWYRERHSGWLLFTRQYRCANVEASIRRSGKGKGNGPGHGNLSQWMSRPLHRGNEGSRLPSCGISNITFILDLIYCIFIICFHRITRGKHWMHEFGDYAPDKAREKLYRGLLTISTLITFLRVKDLFRSQMNGLLAKGLTCDSCQPVGPHRRSWKLRHQFCGRQWR